MANRLNGLHLRNVGVRLFVDNKKKQDGFGELLFRKYGISGPDTL